MNEEKNIYSKVDSIIREDARASYIGEDVLFRLKALHI